MFMGEYEHSVDSKGRLIIPARFREELGESFVMTKGLDGCLFVYSAEEWHKLEAKIHETPMTTKDARKFMRFFFAGAATCEIDRQGRTLIPPNLRSYAKLSKDVVLAGVSTRIEIWDKKLWDETNSYEDMDEVAEHMADLGIMI